MKLLDYLCKFHEEAQNDSVFKYGLFGHKDRIWIDTDDVDKGGKNTIK